MAEPPLQSESKEAEESHAESQEQLTKIRVLGQGTFGTAYLVRDHAGTSDPGPFKVAKEIWVAHLDECQRVLALEEAKALCSLKHPSILSYASATLQGTRLVLMTEYAEGGNLASKITLRRVAKEEAWRESEIFRMVEQVASSLCHLHSRGIVHRDLKPSNLFLCKGELRLGDFGLARVLENTSMVTRAVGMPHYLSPEVCSNEVHNPKSDLWSLGVVAYELASLRLPFVGKDMREVVQAIMEVSPRPLPEHLNEGLSQLIASLLDKEPNKRPSPEDVLEESILGKMTSPRGSLTSRSHIASNRSRISSETCWDSSPASARRRRRRQRSTASSSMNRSVLQGGLERVQLSRTGSLTRTNTATSASDSFRARQSARRSGRHSRPAHGRRHQGRGHSGSSSCGSRGSGASGSRAATRRRPLSATKTPPVAKPAPEPEPAPNNSRVCLCCQWPQAAKQVEQAPTALPPQNDGAPPEEEFQRAYSSRSADLEEESRDEMSEFSASNAKASRHPVTNRVRTPPLQSPAYARWTGEENGSLFDLTQSSRSRTSSWVAREPSNGTRGSGPSGFMPLARQRSPAQEALLPRPPHGARGHEAVVVAASRHIESQHMCRENCCVCM